MDARGSAPVRSGFWRVLWDYKKIDESDIDLTLVNVE